MRIKSNVILIFYLSLALNNFAQFSFKNLSYDFGNEFKIINEIDNIISFNETKNDCLINDFFILYNNDTLEIKENTFTLIRKERKNTSDTFFIHKINGEIFKIPFLGLNRGIHILRIEKQFKNEICRKDLLKNKDFKIYFLDSIEGKGFTIVDFEAFVINQKGDTISLPWQKKYIDHYSEEYQIVQKKKFSKYQLRIIKKNGVGSILLIKSATFYCPLCCGRTIEFNRTYKITN